MSPDDTDLRRWAGTSTSAIVATTRALRRSLANLLWLILAGWWLALGHLVTGALLALANFKLIPISLWPFGREIVPTSIAGQLGTPAVTVPQHPAAGHEAGEESAAGEQDDVRATAPACHGAGATAAITPSSMSVANAISPSDRHGIPLDSYTQIPGTTPRAPGPG